MDHAPSAPVGPGLHRAWTSSPGGGRLRVVPWQGDRYVALIGPGRTGRAPTASDVERCLQQLRDRGVTRAVTPALSPHDGRPFALAGFEVHEHLHLLSFRLDKRPPIPTRPLKAGRPWHRRVVLDIDRRAFEPFWQFDSSSLNEARRATPTSRYRIAHRDGKPIGYAVTGRAGDRGYLQRLAVDPDHAGEGLGTDLVNDSLTWLYQRGASMAMVNTQERNTRALGLYRHLGFEEEPDGLVVLQWPTSA